MREESLTSNSLGIPADSNRPGNPLAAMTQVPQCSAKLIAVNRQPNSCDDQESGNKAKSKRGTQGLIVLATRKPRVSKRTLILR